jgi:hypothetical protein
MHRSHDYRHLLARWRLVAKRAGLRMRKLVQADGYDLYVLRTPALQETGGVYISAGIHGDEPGATEGLLAWAEKQGRRLAKLPLFILPCLNPWGLIRNIRTSATGLDLNRSFHLEDVPMINGLRHAATGQQFAAALMMHEDYDGEGVYLYELQRLLPYWGEALLGAASQHLPIDPRLRIEGRKAVRGIHRRKVDPKVFDKIGYPEAIWLHQRHAARTFTVETPSEFALEKRIAAQIAMLDELMRQCGLAK